MRYQITFFERNENFCHIEVDREFPRVMNRFFNEHAVRFHSGMDLPKRELYRDLLAVDGVERIRTDRYTLRICKATPFLWKDVLPGVLYVLNMYLAPDDKPQEVAKPKTVPLHPWEKSQAKRTGQEMVCVAGKATGIGGWRPLLNALSALKVFWLKGRKQN
jgi:hypothetical protein